ncbi:hypothetical protein AXF42_Ash004616 [Apostasia shenzhenica]|uniref:Uncharacterized protein n=1 Tax=Apostasia shenzhenica TaxID=1088818 RepID=A0A2I0BH81_9ASPA|nr:hypothetical protein AXF42_Ash004616 [Apostasia shenzhenica]
MQQWAVIIRLLDRQLQAGGHGFDAKAAEDLQILSLRLQVLFMSGLLCSSLFLLLLCFPCSHLCSLSLL